MLTTSYQERRGQLESYFDRTATAAWSRLTSDAPVSRIRATVRAGRDQMRATLLDWLPAEMHGMRVLDAGCGTGALAVEMARRGAAVIAVDLASTLLETARQRLPADVVSGQAGCGSVEFHTGDMLGAEHGEFDYIVAMDSLIHYRLSDVLGVLGNLTARTRRGILFTFAPRTPLLTLMHGVGRMFPRGDRAPAIEPVGEQALIGALEAGIGSAGWAVAQTRRVACGFYTSQALELSRRQPC